MLRAVSGVNRRLELCSRTAHGSFARTPGRRLCSLLESLLSDEHPNARNIGTGASELGLRSAEVWLLDPIGLFANLLAAATSLQTLESIDGTSEAPVDRCFVTKKSVESFTVRNGMLSKGSLHYVSPSPLPHLFEMSG